MGWRPEEHQELALRKTVRDLVAVFEGAERDIRTAFAMLVAAEKRLNQAFTLGSHHTIHIPASRYSHDADFDKPDAAIERITREAWETIVERLELRRVMSTCRYDKLQEELKKGAVMPITAANVAAFTAKHVPSLPELFSEAVVEVFDWLRPRHDTYKTNSKIEVGPKVVLESMVERSFGEFHVRCGRRQQLIDLERVLSVLDGQGHTGKGHFSELQGAIDGSRTGRAETPYFRARCFKKGTLHLEFRRLDLLHRFNQIAGGMRLRPHPEESHGPH